MSRFRRFGRSKSESEECRTARQRRRILLTAAASFAVNLSYALYHGILGILGFSLWFLSMGAFYGVLAIMRFSAVLCGRRKSDSPSAGTEYFVMRLSGLLLILLSLILAVVVYLSLSQKIATKYHEILMITIATYTFCKITLAAVRAVRQRKDPLPLFAVIRSISYAEVAASLLTLQRSMLVSFGGMSSEGMFLLNVLTGAAVCLFVWLLGIILLIKGKRKKVRLWPPQNL